MECPPNVSGQLSKRHQLISPYTNNSAETPPKVPQKTPLSDTTQAASSTSVAYEPLYAKKPRFVITDETPE